MYPHNNEYVLGWAGQRRAGYALLVLADGLGPGPWTWSSVRWTISPPPFNEKGFPRYEPDKDRWYGQDPVSQGQAMENFALAILAGRKKTVDTSRWEAFLSACDVHAARILTPSWRPRSTNEGFLVSPSAGHMRCSARNIAARSRGPSTMPGATWR